ncbi:replication initiation negative regulator SeqA [Alteromonas sp. 345S023]|uniref:Replication initiation negative regulator SeqA n=1 Tax=Alteromonas profundi TaxID=2696062 RepID=A0A7X5RMY2_9ALTE|nr:replication initiation negative regulator SeqA [Alteromonas profundi]NDV93000.1 replication initiation negative regulator SeqA [Alteromonas profundi]
MKSIEIDDDLYAFIASQTKHIGESASEILRRLLLPEDGEVGDTSSPRASVNDTVSKTAGTRAAPKKAESAAAKAESVTTVPATKRAAPAKSPRVTARRMKKQTPSQSANASSTASSSAPVAEAATHDKNDIVNMVSEDALSTFTKRVDQFLFILSAAHKLNAENFKYVESIIGKNRTYFATSKEALLENGSSTNPKAIPDSEYWVVTNNNTAKKVNMLEQVLRKLGYAPDVVETIVSRFAPEGK